jgi:hypothetical protein
MALQRVGERDAPRERWKETWLARRRVYAWVRC